MQVDGGWRQAAGTQAIFQMLSAAGYAAYFVGGCVRNGLMGRTVQDIDIATDARPDQVLALAGTAGLNAIPTGIEHGTVTVVSDGIAHEVTTFRADIETDGRHAIVRFSDDVSEDARRRDFTMNALYARADGTVVDPLGGLPDLRARRVRFIEDPARRIAEDHLRILRFFRFSAWYGDPTLGFDPEALSAIAQALDGLDQLSRERVWAELCKLLSAPDPVPALATMAQTGVLTRCLPGAGTRAIGPLVHMEQEQNVAPDPIRRLVALTNTLPDHLRLSKAQSRAFDRLSQGLGSTALPASLGYRLGVQDALSVLLLRAAVFEQTLPQGFRADVAQGAGATCPVSAKDFMPGLSGPDLGEALRQAEAAWIDSGFSLTRADLVAQFGSKPAPGGGKPA